jgi:predicted acylesterase/phospholipase RssA
VNIRGYAISLGILAICQRSCLAQTLQTESPYPVIALADSSDSVVVSDSFEKEEDETKRQIDQSPEEDDVKSLLPPSGQIMTKGQKQRAENDATVIVNQTPGLRCKISAKNTKGNPTVALALGGGGARGAAHLGVLKVLQEEGVPIDYIVGNSMGSIVGGLYSAGVPLDQIQTHLEDLSLRKAYMPGGLTKKLALIPISKLIHPLRAKHYAGLWSGKKLTQYLDRVLPTPNMEVRDTKIPFSPVATNLLDGKAYRITNGRLSTAIKASAAISPLIQPVPMGDKVFIDGGVRANLPASAAKDTGAGMVIAVLVDEPMAPLPAKQFTHLKNIASRMTDIMLAIADERQLQFADVVINPNVSSISVLSNNPEDVRKAVRAGELAARKAMPELRKRLHLQVKTASVDRHEDASNPSKH